jgi:hypothetical protein
MSVKSILPFSYFPNLLITISILLIIVWSRGVVNIVPVLRNRRFLLVFFSFLSATSLTFFFIIVIIPITCPIRNSSFRYWFVRSLVLGRSCFRRRNGRCYCGSFCLSLSYSLCFLSCKLRSLCRLET